MAPELCNLSTLSSVIVFRRARRRATGDLATNDRVGGPGGHGAHRGVVRGHLSVSSSTTRSTSTTTTTVPRIPKPIVAVDLAATPVGWVPVDYGDAQVSVPPTWSDVLSGCAPSRPTVVLDVGSYYGCPPSSKENFIQLLRPATFAYSGKASSTMVNGIKVSFGAGGRFLFAPSLGLTVTTSGAVPTSTAIRVLHTLTYSPRAVALAPNPAPPVPTSWHRVTFGGLSIAVPSSWPVRRTDGVGCEPFVPVAVTLDAGTSVVGGNCLNDNGQYIVMSSTDGLVVDPGPYGPLADDNSFVACRTIGSLSVCPANSYLGDAYYDVLVLAVHVRGRTQPVAVDIGLAGNGMVARTIFDSMRATTK